MLKLMCLVILIFQTNQLQTVQGKLSKQNVLDIRSQWINEELNMMTGHDIELKGAEIEANKIIMDLKSQILEDGYIHPERPIFSENFYQYKEDVDDSKLFKIIQQMPKGGVLHTHDTAVLSPDYVLNMTYHANLYICPNDNCDIQFKFAKKKPLTACNSEWKLLQELRETSKNVNEFDAELRKCFTLKVDNPRDAYPNINVVWNKFQKYFECTSGLFSYIDLWKKYLYDTFMTFRSDNVMYIESRSSLLELYDLNGSIYNAIDSAKVIKLVADQFVKDYPDFFGVKLIYAPYRFVNNEKIKEYLITAKKLKKIMPDFFAGFDLVGQEDVGNRTQDFTTYLSEAADDINYFFHAGETNWYGFTDDNLYDAIALNTKRIGHGYALLKHPVLLDIVKQKKIAIEVNVVSNQVLKLVEDLRNHPLVTFLAMDVPVVISSDDPGVWEATPLSHDFYMAFIACTHVRADLRLLKKLTLNSLYYSSIKDKHRAVNNFEIQWNKFINNLVNDRLLV